MSAEDVDTEVLSPELIYNAVRRAIRDGFRDHLSFGAMAKASGVSKTQIWNIHKEKKQPTLKAAFAILKAAGWQIHAKKPTRSVPKWERSRPEYPETTAL